MTEKEEKQFRIELQTMLKSIKPNVIARTVLADGRYYASKESEQVTILKQSSEGNWKAVKTIDVKSDDNIVLLSKCQQFGDGFPVTVAVSEAFSDFPLKSFFSFEVINGKTRLSNEILTKKQVEELTK